MLIDDAKYITDLILWRIKDEVLFLYFYPVKADRGLIIMLGE
jgi:hypothetical protein